MCKPAPNGPLMDKQACPKPRRSKLKRLKRLQRQTRTQQHNIKETRPSKLKADTRLAQGQQYAAEKADTKQKRVCERTDEAALPKRPKVEAGEKNELVVASSPVALSVDAVALRSQLHLKVEEDPYGDCPAPVQSFAELSELPQRVVSSLQRHGITAPMPIQAQALPLVLRGRDVIGLAQTGSGKTLAFLLPASVHLEKHRLQRRDTPRVPSPSMLVLAPTRELAVQIADEANKVFDVEGDWGSSDAVHTVAVYGGEDKSRQQNRLRWGADIVVATPGRLSDFVNTNVISLNRVTYFVLDEADRMLDMGFHDEVSDIAKKIQPERQVLFFSATWEKGVQELAQGLCKRGSKPVRISCGQESNTVADGKLTAREGIVQEVIVIDHPNNGTDDHWTRQEREKEVIMERHLKKVLTASEEHKLLVFVSQKHLADKLSKRLQDQGFKADAMHGGKSQDYRLWVLDQFRKGELRLLVCTDVLGRGIDIPSVSHVVIHEMGEIEDYIHRIGRTARGKYGKGHALVFFEYWDGCPNLAAELIDVLEASKQPVPDGLRLIADEVARGKRKSRGTEWKAPFASNKWNNWGKHAAIAA